MRIFPSQSKKVEAVQFNIAPPKETASGHGIALVVIVKNEADAISEWLQFHLAVGVDTFIIYDDGSSDGTIDCARKVLEPDKLIVIPWSQRIQDAKLGRALHNQGLAFAHAVANFRQHHRWMGFIDIDEFLFPTRANSLAEVLDRLVHVDNILLPWHMFGRQGFEETPEKILPSLTRRFRNPYETAVKGILNFKCLVNPSKVTKVYVHGFETSGAKTIWNSVGKEFQYGEHKLSTFHAAHDLQLNHYYAKSNAQLEQKIGKGSIGESIFTKAFKNIADRRSLLTKRVNEIERDTVEDRCILDFCERVGFDAMAK